MDRVEFIYLEHRNVTSTIHVNNSSFAHVYYVSLLGEIGPTTSTGEAN